MNYGLNAVLAGTHLLDARMSLGAVKPRNFLCASAFIFPAYIGIDVVKSKDHETGDVLKMVVRSLSSVTLAAAAKHSSCWCGKTKSFSLGKIGATVFGEVVFSGLQHKGLSKFEKYLKDQHTSPSVIDASIVGLDVITDFLIINGWTRFVGGCKSVVPLSNSGKSILFMNMLLEAGTRHMLHKARD